MSLPGVVARSSHSLSGLDAGFLYLEASGTPMHVGSLMRLSPPRGRRDFHRALQVHIADRLARAAPLRRRLQWAPMELGHPFWVQADDVDLDFHVQRQRLPGPGSQAQLLARVARLHAVALPRDRPLWQMVVIEGLADGELALYTKIHHALLDGQGAVALARALLDLAPKPLSGRREPSPGPTPSPPGRAGLTTSSLRASVHQVASLLRALPAALKLAGGAALTGRLRDSVLLAPRTPFNTQVGAHRRFAVASLDLDRVKQVARGYGVSVNDVVLALCASALREHLLRRKALPARPLIAAMPFSLRRPDDAEANNQVSMAQCPLATDLADPVARLRAIASDTGQIKQRVAEFGGLVPTDFPGLGAPLWASGLSRLWARGRVSERLPPLANLVVSNVPGPPVPVYLAGARVSHYFPVSIVTHGLALNITVHSYNGRLDFGLVSCRDALPRPMTLATGLQRALEALSATVEP